MYERFTDRSRKVMQLANQEALRFHHEYIGTEHILLGLIKEGSGVAANVLKNLNIDLLKIRMEIENIVQAGPTSITMGKLPQTPRAKKVIEYSIEEARNLNHNYVGTEHLLLGLLREEEGVGAQVLMNLGLKLADVREEVLNLLGHDVHDDTAALGTKAAARPGAKTPALDSFGLDLTSLAREGKLAPVLGRQQEISRVIRVLGRRSKNNPVLVGEAGVGKSALVRGVAERIVSGDVPPALVDCRLIAVDLVALGATPDRKAEAERVNALINEVRRGQNIILFFDDLPHNLRIEKATYALIVALTKDDIRCIGATTPYGFDQYVATESILRRLFQPIHVQPASAELTLEILRQLRPRYEEHHHVRISDAALQAAIDLSERELRDAFLPDKAIDVLDEAGALVRLRTVPRALDMTEVDEQLDQINQEKEAAVAEQNFDRAARLRDEADQLKKDREHRLQEWQAQADAATGIVDESVIAEVVQELAGPAHDESMDIPF